MTRKSYNPFKMWGAYIGAVLMFFSISLAQECTFSGRGICGVIEGLYFPIILLSKIGILLPIVGTFGAWSLFAIVSIYGFLLGWGVHSLFRALKKRGKR